MTLQAEQEAQADALDVWIEQERQLITHYEARAARAEATAAAAVTAVLGLAALTAAAAESSTEVDGTFAWLVVVALAVVCILALAVRTVAGLRRSKTSLVSSGSDEFDTALKKLRECDHTKLDPLDVRRCTLELCVRRSTDAHETAKAKDQAAAFASAALALALIAVLVLRFLAG